MARMKGGILRGKIGNVVYSGWREIEIVKSAPQRSKDSWSEKQLMHRQRFKAIRDYCGKYRHTLIPQIWNLAAQNGHGTNLFLKANTPAFALDGELTAIDKLHFSAGSLPLPQQITAKRQDSDPSKLRVDWTNDANLSGAYALDELLMVAAYPDHFTSPIATGLLRKSGGGVVDLPSDDNAITGIWLFFKAHRKEGYSDNLYFKI